MAVTVTRLWGPSGAGGRWEAGYRVTGDSSYPTGGWALTKAQLGASASDPSVVVECANDPIGFRATYDHTNQKLAVSAGAAQVANATNMATANFDLVVNYALAI